MAKVNIEFSDGINDYPLEENISDTKNNLNKFLEKYASELDDEFVSSFYGENDIVDGIDILPWLKDLSIDTHDEDPKIKTVLNLISKTVGENQLGFSLGYEGFSDKFYEDFYNAIKDGGGVTLDFKATVVGYGDEYTSCSITLTDKGWNVDLAELYVWDEDEGEYQIP